MIKDPVKWFVECEAPGLYFAYCGHYDDIRVLLCAAITDSPVERNESVFWQLNIGVLRGHRRSDASIYRTANETDYSAYFPPRGATKERFIDYLAHNFPEQLEWFLFHPELLQ